MNAPMPNLKDGYKLFHEGSLALSELEANGIKIDVPYLDATIGRLKKQLAKKHAKLRDSKFWDKWQRRFGEKANAGSPKQLGVMLKSVGVDLEEDEDTGHLKVDKHALAGVDLTFVKDLISIREDDKVLNTYLRGIRREVGDDGRLHPSYNLTSGDEGGDEQKGGAESLRGSCRQPNFQNIPIRNKDMAGMIRPAFIFKGRGVERDFSGIEVKAAACYTKDKNLIKYVSSDAFDMHGDAAMDMFIIPKEEIKFEKKSGKKTFRDSGKNQFVFPEFYGSVYWQCAEAIWEQMVKRDFRLADGTSIIDHLKQKGIKELGDCDPDHIKQHGTKKGTFVHHLKNVEDIMWNKRFAEYTQWKKDWYALYLRRGWFPLKTGFVCRGYYRRNQVLNFAIQGSAFHCLLKCIVRITQLLHKYRMRTKLVGQIHDSLLADCPDKEVQDYLDLSQEVMSVWLPKQWPWLIVPIDTEVEVTPLGGNWNDKAEWKRNKKGIWEAAA